MFNFFQMMADDAIFSFFVPGSGSWILLAVSHGLLGEDLVLHAADVAQKSLLIFSKSQKSRSTSIASSDLLPSDPGCKEWMLLFHQTSGDLIVLLDGLVLNHQEVKSCSITVAELWIRPLLASLCQLGCWLQLPAAPVVSLVSLISSSCH